MKEKNNFLCKKDILEGEKELKSNTGKFKSDNSNLQNFLNKKKIKFFSAFDHKGSKRFLHSKKAALQKIIIDDNSNSLNNDSDFQSEDENKKAYKYLLPKYDVNNSKKKKNKSTNNLVLISKNKLKNKSHDKNLISSLVSNELNAVKKLKCNFSSHELLMFKDKELKKIKPIKKSKNKDELKNKQNEIKFFHFVEGESGFDSSLFNIVTQIK